MNRNFAELVDEAAQDRGLNDYQLSAAIGLLEGNRVYSPKQVSRLRRGLVKHPIPEVVERLVVILRLDPAEAFAAARVLPRGFDADHFRQLEFFTREPVPAGAARSALTRHYLKTAVKAQGMAEVIQLPVGPGAQGGHIERSERRRRYRRSGDSRKQRRTPQFVADVPNTASACGTRQVGRAA